MRTTPNSDSHSDVEQAILKHRAAVSELQPCTCSDERALILQELANALMSDYARSFKHERVEEAISVFEEILELRPLGYGQRDEAVSNLGGALYLVCCYNKADSTRAHRSVELLREALRLRPSSHPLRDQALHKLAKCLTWLCSQGDLSVTVLTESICLGREVLQLRPVGHPERDNALGDLASALMSLFEHCGDPTFMLECLSLNREALQLRKPGHPRRPMSLNNLANALWKLASFQGGLERLAEADSLLRELLELSPPGHIMRVRVLDNLANSLGTRYELQALPASLSESIALRRQAREILTEAHPEYTRIIHNLAESLVADFRARHQLSSVTEAIGLFRRSLLLRPLEDPTRHYSLECLAEALLANFDECKDTVCLLEAIALQREVLNLRPRGHALRPVSLQRLGRQLCRREVCSWDEALALFREASEFCLAGSAACASLLSDMSVCFLDPSSPFFDLSAGISCLSDGYADELSHVNQRLGQAVSDLRRVETAYTLSTKDTDASTRASYNERVMDLHAQVIGLLPRVANFGLDHKTRLQVITGSDEVARNAAARALRLGCIPKAMEFLEAGRGIFWSQTLYLRSTEFDGVPGHDRETLIRLLQMLEYGARTAVGFDQTVAQREEAMEKRRQLNEEAETLISKIRTYPGCTRFLLPAAFNNLFEGLPDGFVVVLNTSKVAHHALLLNKATGLAASVELEPPPTGFDFAALRAGLPRDMDAQLALLDESPARAMRLDWGLVSSFDIALSQLWSSIVHPVIRALGLDKATGRARPRLWWCVTGELSFLPIHAAGEVRSARSSALADFVISSYVPTLLSLTKARGGWKPISRSSITGLVICETYTDHGSARHLPGAEKEVRLVRSCFDLAHGRVLNAHSPHTSLALLRTLLQETPANVIHLACHGVQDPDPLSSALVMQDGRITIEDMLHLDAPQAVLAYLSACQTAMGDTNVPDQAVHLAASMLFCGFRSVVGTMWLMHDEDGPKLAQHFYEALFAQEALDLDDIPYALDEAIEHLRRQGVPAERWALFMHMGG